jgi:DNA-binding transcriptional LysR family regulator
MNLQQLRCVAVVAECGSFSKAAKRLYLSQPSVSAIIKDLETELGIVIFERSNRGITMTMPGAQLLKYAQQMLECEETIRETFTADAKLRPAVFSVVSQHYPFVCSALIHLIRELDAKNYRFHLRETTTASILAGVASCQDDIGVLSVGKAGEKKMQRTLKSNGLQYQPLFSGMPRVYLSKTHPLSNRQSIRQEELSGYPCILYEQKDNVLFPYAEETTLLKKNADQISASANCIRSACHAESGPYTSARLMRRSLTAIRPRRFLEGGEPNTVGYGYARRAAFRPSRRNFWPCEIGPAKRIRTEPELT